MRYSIIGFGPVGSRIATAAARVGHHVTWYDPNPALISQFARAGSIIEAARDADRLISAVPAGAATAVYESAALAFTDDLVYEDWSSAMPAEKRAYGGMAGERYVDVTLLDPVTAAEPLLCLAGSRAEAIAVELGTLGFAAVVAGPSPGDAATVKMVRSAFMKPFEALAIELVRTSAQWDPNNVAIGSVARTLRTDFRDLVTMLLETNRQHAARRADELGAVRGSVALPSGLGLLDAAKAYFDGLIAAWARADAPPVGASEQELAAFLDRERTDRA